MSDRPDYAREIRNSLTDVRRLCEQLGLLVGLRSFQRQAGGGLLIRCPWHDEKTPSCSVRVAKDGTIAVKCHGCQASGDALSLVAQVRGLSLRTDFRAVLVESAQLAGLYSIIDEIERGQSNPERPRVEPPKPRPELADRDYPPWAEVGALWNASTLTSDAPAVAAWLRGRGLDPERVDGRVLARALPCAEPLPRWAVTRGGSWRDAGYLLVVPMFDATGTMRTLRAARVVDSDLPKRIPPFGHRASGVVMADEWGVAMLAGVRAPERVVVVEGEPDFWTWATHTTDPRTAVIGIVSGSWTPGLAARFPIGAQVAIRTDHDQAGERYAAEIVDSLKRRCFLFRSRGAA